jgi:hypothetical protein
MYDAILSRTIGQVSPESVTFTTPQPRPLLIEPENSVIVFFLSPKPHECLIEVTRLRAFLMQPGLS